MSCKNYRSMHAYMVTPTGIYNAENDDQQTTTNPIGPVELSQYGCISNEREESSMHLYSMKYGNDQI